MTAEGTLMGNSKSRVPSFEYLCVGEDREREESLVWENQELKATLGVSWDNQAETLKKVL